MADRTERIVDAGGLPLAVVEQSPEGSVPVLLLHGYLDNAATFFPLMDHLPAVVRAAALEFRGHGRSGHAPIGAHYNVTDYLADVEHALDALGLEKAHLVGHSMGGNVSLLFASARPDRVLSVTSIESIGPSGGPGELAVERLRRYVGEIKKPLQRRRYASIEEAAQRLVANNSTLPIEAARLLARRGTAPFEGGVAFTFDPAHRRTFGIVFDEEQTLALFSAIRCPVQLIHGTHGFSFEDEQMRRRLAALRCPSPQPIPGGHHVHLEQPAAVALKILQHFGL